MDTKINFPSGLSKLREAESADVRYELLHQPSPLLRRRRKGADRSDSGTGLDDDEAVVSTEALLLFLESYLRRHYGTATLGSDGEQAPKAFPNRSDVNIEAMRFKAAHAVQAYAHAAEVTQKVQKRAKDTDECTVDENDENFIALLSLMREIRQLSRNDIDYVKIGRGADFVKSVSAAVKKAKEEIS